jgi:calnexin
MLIVLNRDEDAPKFIPDESAQMPSDWLVNEPLEIPDPDAIKPEDW